MSFIPPQPARPDWIDALTLACIISMLMIEAIIVALFCWF